jgi:hypothetical protein
MDFAMSGRSSHLADKNLPDMWPAEVSYCAAAHRMTYTNIDLRIGQRARRLFFNRCSRILVFLRFGFEKMNVPEP